MKKKGMSLIEILVAIGLSAIIIPGLFVGFAILGSDRGSASIKTDNTLLLVEAQEAIASIKANSWNDLSSNGTYHPVLVSNAWTLASGAETINGSTRQITIADVFTDSNLDHSKKEITYEVDGLQTKEIISRFENNLVANQTSVSDFNLGTLNNITILNESGGEISLTSATSSGNISEDFTTSSNYTFDSNKIEVVNGYAQLKGQGSPASGQTTNSGFDTNLNGWTFTSYGTVFGQTGTRVATGGTPGGYAQINFPRTSNRQGGGYLYQAFTSTASNPTSSLSFNWRVTSYPTATTSLRLYAWIDNVATGTPVTQVWDSGNITATGAWSGLVSVDTSSFITTPGTYYLKIGAFINVSSGNKGPYTLGFDNVLLNWSGNANSYANDSPTIVPNTSLQIAGVTSWSSFAAVEVPNGGSVRYQLSSDDGTTWKYWNGGIWATATLATQYNDATTIDSNISTFTVASEKILVKVFLIGDGTQQVKIDSFTIGYNGPSGSNSGDFVSSTIDTGQVSSFNRLEWTEQQTVNTTIKFQIAINSDNTTWQFVGPDGTAGTYFTGGGGTIFYSNILGRYFKYKIYLTSTNTDIPKVLDMSINYSI